MEIRQRNSRLALQVVLIGLAVHISGCLLLEWTTRPRPWDIQPNSEPSDEAVLSLMKRIEGRERLAEPDAEAISRLVLKQINNPMQVETVHSLRVLSDKEAELRTTWITGHPGFVYRLTKDGSGWRVSSTTARELETK